VAVGRLDKRSKKPRKPVGRTAEPKAPPPPPMSRRSFLSRIWIWLCGLALAEAAWIGVSFLWPRKGGTGVDDGAGVVVAGPSERFEPNSVTAFREGKFYLVRLEDGGFLALHRKCTHLGCTVPWIADEHRFACPCHASVFDMRGEVLNPPAPRPLDLFAVRIENGIVKVDTRKTIRRSAYEPGQVTRS
jgi:cytochrome b6-f complex iron-sulfur subunit